MRDYYEILDIPITATPAEIKAQYRQLVRIYHPDRFRDQDDKAYAEEKLKEINIAFQVLSGTSVHRGPFEARVAPQPVAYPPVVDFGTIPSGQKVTKKVQIGNIGGPAESINFVYSCEKPWFQISKGKRVYGERAFPLDFEVTVDTRHLEPGRLHQEWLEAVLDGIPVRIGLQAQIIERQQPKLVPMHWRWMAVGVFLLLTAFFILPILGISSPALKLSEALISARPAYELHQDEMLFSVQENSTSALYVGLEAGNAPRRLGVTGAYAVGSHTGQRIAYLDYVGDIAQVFLFELTTGETEQITQDTTPKSMLAWSPDGSRLAYLIGEDREQRISVYGIRTREEHLLPGEIVAGVTHFVWSPEGDAMLFDLWQGDERRVYRMSARGDDLRQLTHFDSWAGAWSADGSQIIVGTDHGLYLLGSNGQQLQQLNNAPVTSFSWSADGEWIVYTTSGDPVETVSNSSFVSESQTLWLMNRNGKELRQLTHESTWQQWSPTGSILGYVTGNLTGKDSLLYLWTFTPGEVPQLVAEVNEPFFAWPQ